VLQEPRLALDGGPDGLSFYRRLATGYAPFLAKGGLLALEIGFDQGEAVRALFQGGKMIQDICGRDRVILLEG
jgi:release factor glutamine methyltransferase